MEKETRTQVVKDKIIHNFYCDECGKFIDFSEENDVGYYMTYGDYDARAYIINYGWLKYHKHLCDDCKEIIKNKLVSTLKEVGFRGDDEE